ncbi:hypothetical protein TRFO_20365 [Tritrichomonas foetus]|uniref:Uncharacterized protein n=1 Tax=Tritrichomonas foetus TaxID=1144522 RepID=A0A1J4KHH9_9EUKA|nr:hypothetical protein TRFO_20365 [Tritrichomonas foetus]|eukprot:OHT10400.1 hypothetical protein TRFO_20365 [Tritrichomonas foetus]
MPPRKTAAQKNQRKKDSKKAQTSSKKSSSANSPEGSLDASKDNLVKNKNHEGNILEEKEKEIRQNSNAQKFCSDSDSHNKNEKHDNKENKEGKEIKNEVNETKKISEMKKTETNKNKPGNKSDSESSSRSSESESSSTSPKKNKGIKEKANQNIVNATKQPKKGRESSDSFDSCDSESGQSKEKNSNKRKKEAGKTNQKYKNSESSSDESEKVKKNQKHNKNLNQKKNNINNKNSATNTSDSDSSDRSSESQKIETNAHQMVRKPVDSKIRKRGGITRGGISRKTNSNIIKKEEKISSKNDSSDNQKEKQETIKQLRFANKKNTMLKLKEPNSNSSKVSQTNQTKKEEITENEKTEPKVTTPEFKPKENSYEPEMDSESESSSSTSSSTTAHSSSNYHKSQNGRNKIELTDQNNKESTNSVNEKEITRFSSSDNEKNSKIIKNQLSSLDDQFLKQKSITFEEGFMNFSLLYKVICSVCPYASLFKEDVLLHHFERTLETFQREEKIDYSFDKFRIKFDINSKKFISFIKVCFLTAGLKIKNWDENDKSFHFLLTKIVNCKPEFIKRERKEKFYFAIFAQNMNEKALFYRRRYKWHYISISSFQEDILIDESLEDHEMFKNETEFLCLYKLN